MVTLSPTSSHGCLLFLALVAGSIGQLHGFLPQSISTVERSPHHNQRILQNSGFLITPTTKKTTTTSTRLYNKLWDRLQVEEDEEPFWYLVNCVAGLEMDLLRQCRDVCKDMPDAYKFVVPTEVKTRSHGAKRMVMETKVKYQGYVFAKLRLCPDTYEAIQQLDLCRSWMGTVNHIGHKKLPPAPVALNEDEVEGFDLEDLEFEEEEEQLLAADGETPIIIDEAADEDKQKKAEAEAIKVFLGIKVDDMVKVTKKCKFFNEDGIVRRLKDGKIFLRFYTYGSMFEEWMDPGDVRKLSDTEVLKGLSGPSEPVTQRDFEEEGTDDYDANGRKQAGSFRRDLMGNALVGGREDRNRREDRVQRGENKRDFFGDSKSAEKNWDWYKENKRDNSGLVSDEEGSYRAGSKGGDASANADMPPSQRQQRRDQKPNQQNGNEDWSAFVSPASAPKKSGGEDDFFSSLMTDLNKDLNTGDSRPSSPAPQSADAPSAGSGKEEDDFFASLMAEIDTESEAKEPGSPADSGSADDFFASLDSSNLGSGQKSKTKDSSFNEDDLFDSFDVVDSKDKDSSDVFTSLDVDDSKPKATKAPAVNSEDDFFASLEAELGSALDTDDDKGSSGPANIEDDDFFASLEQEVSSKLDNEEVKEKAAAAAPKGKSKPAENVSQSPPSGGEDLGKLTVPKLKELLKARGLKVSGKKAELIERLND